MGRSTRIRLVVAFAAAMGLLLSACGGGSSSSSAAGAGPRQKLVMWFWGAPPAHQKTMQDVLVDGFNTSQDKYTLSVTYDNNVDSNVQVALAANKGPDVVYSSGPSYAAAYASEGKLADLDSYSAKYGWKDKLLSPMYESGTVAGKLYDLPNSVSTYGVFYNKKVLATLGVPAPTTFAELTADMDKAKSAKLYASVTGNKGWKPVNLDYASIFLNHDAGPTAVYDAVQGKTPWTSASLQQAVAASAAFYKSGYLAGKDYSNLNFDQSMQLLAAGKSPFFFAPTLAFQFATDYFNDAAGNTSDLGFTAFPNVNPSLPSPTYALGTTAALSVNANSPNKDGAAEVINYMMTEQFFTEMTKTWPGYWGVPLKTLDTVDATQFTGLSNVYVKALQDMNKAVDSGNFGLDISTFFPPATQTALTNIDTVWLGTATPEEFLKTVQTAYDKDKAKNLIAPVPQPQPNG
jgi:raffinose/stachyose/melibiose transport system substrate-binding protein